MMIKQRTMSRRAYGPGAEIKNASRLRRYVFSSHESWAAVYGSCGSRRCDRGSRDSSSQLVMGNELSPMRSVPSAGPDSSRVDSWRVIASTRRPALIATAVRRARVASVRARPRELAEHSCVRARSASDRADSIAEPRTTRLALARMHEHGRLWRSAKRSQAGRIPKPSLSQLVCHSGVPTRRDGSVIIVQAKCDRGASVHADQTTCETLPVLARVSRVGSAEGDPLDIVDPAGDALALEQRMILDQADVVADAALEIVEWEEGDRIESRALIVAECLSDFEP